MSILLDFQTVESLWCIVAYYAKKPLQNKVKTPWPWKDIHKKKQIKLKS